MGFNFDFNAWIKKRTWQDLVLLAIIIFVLLLQHNLISSYNQLPSPIYGGDMYLQLGAITHTADGGSPFVNFRNSDPIPNYLPFYTMIVGGTANIFGIEPMDAMFAFSYIFAALGVLILYFLGYAIFRDKTIALFFPLIYRYFMILIKYGHFARWVIFPLFFLVLYLALSENDKKKKYIYAGLTGIVYGLASISHGTSFPSISLFLLFVAVYMFIIDYLKKNKETKKISFQFNEFKQGLKKNITTFLLIVIPGFIIAQIYWFTLLKNFILGEGAAHAALIQLTSTPLVFPSPFLIILKNIFLLTQNVWAKTFSIPALLGTILVWVCVISYFFFKKLSKPIKYSILLLSGSILILLFFSIASSVLGFNLKIIMNYTADFWGSITRVVVASAALFFILKLIKKKSRIIFYVVVGVLLVLLVLGHYMEHRTFVKNNRWHQVGKTTLPVHLTQMSDYIRDTTDVNDVILTNKELAFSINALTGRKFVAQPNGQKNQLYDFATRDRDLALMLYANESGDEHRLQLFREYGVKYFYWDNYWIESEIKFDNQGNVQYLFDPIELLRTDENKELLDNYGIAYSPEFLEINPNYRGQVPKFEVFLIFPNFNATHPWAPSLDKFLVLEREIKTPQDQLVSRFYRVVY